MLILAGRAVQRLWLVALVLFGLSCADEGLPRTRPPGLSERLVSCPTQQQQRGALRHPVWDLYVVDGDWDALTEDVKADVEVEAQVCIGGKLESIGLEFQGTSGRLRDKKSFKIKFTRDHALRNVGFGENEDGSIDKVYLRAVWLDQSMIREALAFDLWREMGHVAPHTGFANLLINGAYWGLYSVIEPVDKDYLERNGYPADGQLYKATRKNGSRADFAPGRDLVKAFEDKTGEETESRDELAALIATLQKTPLDEVSFDSEIDPIFPLDEYIDRMIWVSLTRNGDAVAQNYYLYNAPLDGHSVWYQIPWDSDLCMGASWRDRDAVVPPDVSLLLDGGNYFGRRLIKVPGIRERYASRFREVLDEVLPESRMLRQLDEHAARVRRDLEEDQLRWQRNVAPHEAFDVVRDYLSQRPQILRIALDEMFSDAMLGEPAPTTVSR